MGRCQGFKVKSPNAPKSQGFLAAFARLMIPNLSWYFFIHPKSKYSHVGLPDITFIHPDQSYHLQHMFQFDERLTFIFPEASPSRNKFTFTLTYIHQIDFDFQPFATGLTVVVWCRRRRAGQRDDLDFICSEVSAAKLKTKHNFNSAVAIPNS